jgi:hypothetical protein
MRANDCVTEVERRPSAEHAGCGATVHAVRSSLWCAGSEATDAKRSIPTRCLLVLYFYHCSMVPTCDQSDRPLLSETAAGAGGAVCNSDCDGSVWLSTEGGERGNGGQGFLPEDEGCSQWDRWGAR